MSLKARRQELLDQAGLGGDEFCAAYAAAADEWLTGLLHRAAGDDLEGLALMAVGGYGRGELCPSSDLDVVLVHRGRRDIASVADAVWYPVWDQGVRLDHSVRRPAEVLEVAAGDLRAQLGLLDGRLVAGDETVTAPLLEQAAALWRSSAPRWLPIVAQQVEERHRANGDVAFLLEPELKESHGGLRDVFVVGAAARAVPAIADQFDLAALEAPRSILTATRVELHRSTGRATDRLLLQEQDQVAAALGQTDADSLMADVAGAGRTIAWTGDSVWRRRSLWEAPPRRRRSFRGGRAAQPDQGAGPDLIEPGIALDSDPDRPDQGEIVLAPGTDPAADPTLAVRMAAVAAERSLPVSPAALAALAESWPAPPDPWPDELRQGLVRVLSAGEPAIAALEALDQYGLLVRLLPEWAAVRNRPQRNAYHRFTVDRHLLESAAQAAPLAVRVARPDLLLVGALLHDIGKGYPGDHTEVGIEIVTGLGARMGFPPADVEILLDMIRHHLLLPDVATRRDLDDPATLDAVVAAVGDRTTLELLGALTEADSQATGPAAWGPWKAGLVADLVHRAAARFSGDELPTASLITDRHRHLMDQVGRTGRSVVANEGSQVTVVAGNRSGLLAAVTGVLTLHGLDVRSANMAGEGDYAVEVFTVEPAQRRWPDWDQFADDLEAVLRRSFPLEERLAQRASAYQARGRAVSAWPAPTHVIIDNGASATSTVVEVRTADAVGLLHRITRALFDCHLDVVAARVQTLGHEVVDAFYVADDAGAGKITDPGRIRAVDDAVHRAVGMPGTDHRTVGGDRAATTG